ncbi:MAG: site-specific integrase [Gammaproteobacteria bacterium]|nr:site-specific integrase [Gammaproteobacteria bacterium]
MATIRKRVTQAGTKYQVQIRKKGYKPVSRSFNTLKDAQTFTKDIEAKMERSVYQCANDAEALSFGELAEQYLNEILIHKKGYDKEKYNIRPIIRCLKGYKLINIRPHVISTYKKDRLQEVSPSTVKRELGLISRILAAAEKDFGIYLPQGNAATKVKKPVETSRDRRPTSNELELLKSDKIVGNYVVLAIETGMRRGEIVNIKPEHVIGNNRNLLLIPETKTDIPRTIPLTQKAIQAVDFILMARGRALNIKADSLSQAFLRACKRHNITDLHFHDLRHEATSSFFERGLNIMEVSLITGHRSLSMLQRYTHLKPESLIDRLNG